MTHQPEDAELGAIVAELIPLIDGEQDFKWSMGDVLVKRINPAGARAPADGVNNGASGWYVTIARLLAAQGREVKAETLRNRYRTASAFPSGTRHSGVAWATHYVFAATVPASEAPAKMGAYLAAAAARGETPSKRGAQAFLGIPVQSQTGEPGASEYIAAHPEIVAEMVTRHPEIAAAIAANLDAFMAIMSERQADDDDTERAPRDPAKPRDYGRLLESAVNSISVALVAAKSGRYELTSRDEALLYFVTLMLGERLAPTGDLVEMVGPKLSANLDEIERYANAGGMR